MFLTVFLSLSLSLNLLSWLFLFRLSILLAFKWTPRRIHSIEKTQLTIHSKHFACLNLSLLHYVSLCQLLQQSLHQIWEEKKKTQNKKPILFVSFLFWDKSTLIQFNSIRVIYFFRYADLLHLPCIRSVLLFRFNFNLNISFTFR